MDRGKVIRDSSGKAIHMVGGFIDQTKSKAAARKLARLHRAQQMLSSCNEMLIRTSDEGPYVCFRVQDTGEGIPAAIIDRICDPYFTTKDVGKGAGLGLTTSMAIVKSHGGFIHISSELGAGTLAGVYIPAYPEYVEPSLSATPNDHQKGSGETILVVDDEILIRKLTCQALGNFGFRTHSAANGDEALALYIEHQSEIDIVFTDMIMPVMDGPEMIERIRGIDPHARIIATGGIASIPDSPYPTMVSVRHFLPKPYTVESLLKCMRQALDEEIPH